MKELSRPAAPEAGTRASENPLRLLERYIVLRGYNLSRDWVERRGTVIKRVTHDLADMAAFGEALTGPVGSAEVLRVAEIVTESAGFRFHFSQRKLFLPDKSWVDLTSIQARLLFFTNV